MRIAFYAPLKPPDHPTPSGDRFIARAFLEAFRRGGHEVTVASQFRSRENRGDTARQVRLEGVGSRLAARLVRRYQEMAVGERPQAWFTYHLYHKAPDFLGPPVCEALGLPYFVAEASHAPKQRQGPWAGWHARCADTIRQATRIIVINSDDRPCLVDLLGDESRLVTVPLFLDETRFAQTRSDRDAWTARYGLDPDKRWILSVGMMRPGRKVACYGVAAQAFRSLNPDRVEWLIVGDGEARAEVEALVRDVPSARILGVLAPEMLTGLYAASDLFAWPAIDEPLGLVFLEAQAAGLPVVGGRTRGVPDLVQDGVTGTLVAPGCAEQLRHAVNVLLDDGERRGEMGRAAQRYIRKHHSMAGAATHLTRTVSAP